MSLATKIDDLLKEAMRQRDAATVGALRMFKSSVKYHALEKHGPNAVATDEDVITVARREIKKRQDSIESFEKGNRADLAAKERSEAALLESFLPAQMGEAELEALCRKAILEIGAIGRQDMGKAMKAAQALAGGRADNRQLSQLIQRLLP